MSRAVIVPAVVHGVKIKAIRVAVCMTRRTTVPLVERTLGIVEQNFALPSQTRLRWATKLDFARSATTTDVDRLYTVFEIIGGLEGFAVGAEGEFHRTTAGFDPP